MIKYQVRNVKTGQITNEWFSDFADHTYYEENWGKPLRWVKDSDEDVSGAVDTRTVDNFGTQITEYQLPSEFTIEQIDVTAQVEQERINREALQYLADTDWKVLRHLREKALNITTSLTEEQYLILEQERANKASLVIR